MLSDRYPTDITAQAGCMGTEPDSRECVATALSYPVDCIEVHLQIGEPVDFYLSGRPLLSREQKQALSLADLLQQTAERPVTSVCLEIRDPRWADGSSDACARLERQVREAGLIGRVQVKSRDPLTVAAMRDQAPGLPCWLSQIPGIGQEHIPAFCDALAQRVLDCGAIGLHTHFRFLTQLLRQKLIDRNLLLSVWDVDRERDMRRLLAMPVDNITTNRLAILLELRSRILATQSQDRSISSHSRPQVP